MRINEGGRTSAPFSQSALKLYRGASALLVAVRLAALPVAALAVLIALLAALVLLLPFQLAFAQLFLLAVGMAILTHVGVAAAVIAALAILAHGIFSCEYPVGGTMEKRAVIPHVPGNTAK